MIFDTALPPLVGTTFPNPFRIYMGLLGQIGDIIGFSATVRRIKELFPESQITFAVSRKYREAGELLAGLPYVDRLFVTELYFEKLTPDLLHAFECGWPLDLRGDDEVEEQHRHDLVLETRPRHRRHPWWQYDHQVAEMAHMVGVPEPIDLRTEICIPEGTLLPPGTAGKVVLHNDPCMDPRKAWPWENVQELVRNLGEGEVVLVGQSGPPVSGAIDLRGQTTLAQAAAVIGACRCYIGIDSGLMWIAGSLQVPVVGLYGTSYIPAYEAIYTLNPNALYLQAEGDLDALTCGRVQYALASVLNREPVSRG